MEEGWERPARVELPLAAMEQLIAAAFPGQRIAEWSVLATGLANTNLRFRLAGQNSAYVLRLHTRDRAAAHRELALMQQLANDPRAFIPLPPLIYSDPQPLRGQHPYSIWGFVDGTLLQALMHERCQSASAADLISAASACGRTLAALSAYRFERSGAFGPGLEIVQEYGRPSQFVPRAVERALFEGRAGARLPPGFREAFAVGYRDAGGELPADWLPLSRLIDVLSQVTFLDGPAERPRVFAETIEVVKETLQMLS